MMTGWSAEELDAELSPEMKLIAFWLGFSLVSTIAWAIWLLWGPL